MVRKRRYIEEEEEEASRMRIRRWTCVFVLLSCLINIGAELKLPGPITMGSVLFCVVCGQLMGFAGCLLLLSLTRKS